MKESGQAVLPPVSLGPLGPGDFKCRAAESQSNITLQGRVVVAARAPGPAGAAPARAGAQGLAQGERAQGADARRRQAAAAPAPAPARPRRQAAAAGPRPGPVLLLCFSQSLLLSKYFNILQIVLTVRLHFLTYYRIEI